MAAGARAGAGALSRVRAGALLVALALATGCGGEPEGGLTGAWVGEDSAGRPLWLVFGEEDAALWIRDRVPGVQDTTVLRYRADTTATPRRLDLRGFTEGPFAGMVLYGIFELLGRDTLRLDFESGLPGQADARPDTFTASTITFRRDR